MSKRAAAGLAAGALAVGLFGGIALASDGGGDSKATGPGPTKTVNGVPVRYERSREGAVRAALNYEAVLSEAVAKPAAKRRELITAIVIPSRLEGVVNDFESGYRLVDEKFGVSSGATDAIVRSGVVGYRVNAYDESEAEVDLWGVAVAARESTPPSPSGWSTTTLRLRWAGDWKLADTPTRVDGPTPGATDNKELVTRVRDLEGVRYVPAP